MPLPEFITCHSKYITMCDFYMHKDCPETCGYAKDIAGIGIGAMVSPLEDVVDNFGNKKIHNGLLNPAYQPHNK